MTQIVLAIDGPSPNVNSGLPYANSPGTGPFTDEGEGASGTGPGLGLNGIAATTMSDQTTQTLPTTTAVPAVRQADAGIRSGLAVPAGIPTSTTLGVGVTGTGPDQVAQAATTITAEPNQG
jgi:hypothetical protein